MYQIILKDQRLKHDLDELIRVFLKPSDFVFLENRHDADINGIIIEQPEELESKDALKRYYFDELLKHTKYYPPWGILTGVRPTKKCNEYLKEGLLESQIAELLNRDYFLRDDKIKLLLETCRNQKTINKNIGKSSVGIYIGIPFCPTRCVYCSFTSNKFDQNKIDHYLLALFKEIEYVADQLKKLKLYPESIYVGGGTPTALSENDFEMLLQEIVRCFDFSHVKEFTVEAGRPDTITIKKLEDIKTYGGTRISINPQSMHQKTLDEIGRSHSPQKIIEAFHMAKAAGIPIINADIIAGLPGENESDFKSTVEQVLALEPQNITVHTLAMKRASKLKILNKDYNYEEHSFLDGMLNASRKILKSAGYKPYYLYRQKQMTGNFENVGYAIGATQSIYNIRIMEEHQTIIALGAGGISKVYFQHENRHERVPNVSDLDQYIQRIDEMIQRKEEMITRPLSGVNNRELGR